MILSSMLAKAFIIPISDEEIEELKQVVDSVSESTYKKCLREE